MYVYVFITIYEEVHISAHTILNMAYNIQMCVCMFADKHCLM